MTLQEFPELLMVCTCCVGQAAAGRVDTPTCLDRPMYWKCICGQTCQGCGIWKSFRIRPPCSGTAVAPKLPWVALACRSLQKAPAWPTTNGQPLGPLMPPNAPPDPFLPVAGGGSQMQTAGSLLEAGGSTLRLCPNLRTGRQLRVSSRIAPGTLADLCA